MAFHARFAHTNLIAQDWRKLVEFYQKVFGCKPVNPEANLSGQWLEDITKVPGAEIRVIHLLLPGYGDGGPTLEVIRYNSQKEPLATAANRPGFGHIAFAVDDVKEAHDAVIESGGGSVGDIVSVDIPGRGRLTEVYVTDPEGNIIELQKWSR
jgi:catechol 2,3-dioxygenase-like lactoylglutathione lyase family enzyme